MDSVTNTETTISKEDLKQMRLRDQQARLDQKLASTRTLRGGRGARKSSGIMARYFKLRGDDEEPTRVLMMEVRRPAEPKNNQDAIEKAVVKRQRRQYRNLRQAVKSGAGLV